MATVKIKTNQAVLGWPRDHVVEVERTSLVEGLINNQTVTVVDDAPAPAEPAVSTEGESGEPLIDFGDQPVDEPADEGQTIPAPDGLLGDVDVLPDGPKAKRGK